MNKLLSNQTEIGVRTPGHTNKQIEWVLLPEGCGDSIMNADQDLSALNLESLGLEEKEIQDAISDAVRHARHNAIGVINTEMQLDFQPHEDIVGLCDKVVEKRKEEDKIILEHDKELEDPAIVDIVADEENEHSAVVQWRTSGSFGFHSEESWYEGRGQYLLTEKQATEISGIIGILAVERFRECLISIVNQKEYDHQIAEERLSEELLEEDRGKVLKEAGLDKESVGIKKSTIETRVYTDAAGTVDSALDEAEMGLEDAKS